MMLLLDREKLIRLFADDVVTEGSAEQLIGTPVKPNTSYIVWAFLLDRIHLLPRALLILLIS
jgi:hypothetical protein